MKQSFLYSLIWTTLLLTVLSYQDRLTLLPIVNMDPVLFVQLEEQLEQVKPKPKSKPKPKPKPKPKLKPKPKPKPKPKEPELKAEIPPKIVSPNTQAKPQPTTKRAIVSYKQLLQEPRLRFGNPPYYPDRALAMSIEGRIVVKILVDERGRVESYSLIKGDDAFGFYSAVQDAIKTWRFEPYRVRGMPRAFYMIKPFEFELN